MRALVLGILTLWNKCNRNIMGCFLAEGKRLCPTPSRAAGTAQQALGCAGEGLEPEGHSVAHGLPYLPLDHFKLLAVIVAVSTVRGEEHQRQKL